MIGPGRLRQTPRGFTPFVQTAAPETFGTQTAQHHKVRQQCEWKGDTTGPGAAKAA